MPQVNDGEVADVAKPIGAAVQADAQHDVFETGHHAGKILATGSKAGIEL